MNKEKVGISFAGNILVDIVKTIDSYPGMGMLANISEVSQSVGGCVPNTGIDLAKIDSSVPINAIGCVGNDDYGRYVVSRLNEYKIDTGRITVTDDAPTSFSDVMSLKTGDRTFFHARGANAKFSPAQIDLSAINSKMLHAGYILLLDAFDQKDAEYGTVMARFLKAVRDRGIKTSIDVVSDDTGDYAAIVKPALKYTDYAIINEIECCRIWGISHLNKGKLDVPAVKRAMELTLASGVREKVIVHCKEAGFVLDKSGKFTQTASLVIPKEKIKGSLGAGDAFCAGALYGIYNDFDDEHILRLASAAAACSLFSKNSIDGMLSAGEIENMDRMFSRKTM